MMELVSSITWYVPTYFFLKHLRLTLPAVLQIQPITLTRSILNASTLPSPLPPHIQPQYYAAIVAAEAIGKSGDTQISELSIDNPQISGYAFFEGGKAKRLVIINHTPYFIADAEAGTVRPVANVQIDFPEGCNTRNIQVKKLDIQ